MNEYGLLHLAVKSAAVLFMFRESEQYNFDGSSDSVSEQE